MPSCASSRGRTRGGRDRAGDVLFVGHGAVGTLLFCHYSGVAIDRAYDQPADGVITSRWSRTGGACCIHGAGWNAWLREASTSTWNHKSVLRPSSRRPLACHSGAAFARPLGTSPAITAKPLRGDEVYSLKHNNLMLRSERRRASRSMAASDSQI